MTARLARAVGYLRSKEVKSSPRIAGPDARRTPYSRAGRAWSDAGRDGLPAGECRCQRHGARARPRPVEYGGSRTISTRPRLRAARAAVRVPRTTCVRDSTSSVVFSTSAARPRVALTNVADGGAGERPRARAAGAGEEIEPRSRAAGSSGHQRDPHWSAVGASSPSASRAPPLQRSAITRMIVSEGASAASDAPHGKEGARAKAALDSESPRYSLNLPRARWPGTPWAAPPGGSVTHSPDRSFEAAGGSGVPLRRRVGRGPPRPGPPRASVNGMIGYPRSPRELPAPREQGGAERAMSRSGARGRVR